MSANISIHRVVKIVADEKLSGGSRWLTLAFIDANGIETEVTAFGDSGMRIPIEGAELLNFAATAEPAEAQA